MSLSEKTRLELLKIALALGCPEETKKQYRFMVALLKTSETECTPKTFRSLTGEIIEEATGPVSPSTTAPAYQEEYQGHFEEEIPFLRKAAMETKIDGSGNLHAAQLSTGRTQPAAPYSQKSQVSHQKLRHAQPNGGWSHHTSSFPSSTEQHPADSYSAGRTESVSGYVRHQSGCVVHDGPAEQKERHDSGGFPSPTDAELRQHGCPALVEPRARTFLCQLPDSDLAAINAGVIPTPLMKMLGRVAYNEIERRRETDDA
ncbi:hypothetical protein [Parasaccharibacter apium]|uniref:hypothetical protein n=1 Tax=Parasaccharibacter apium TaxID=1510841 RepID=UPI0012ECA436|nr:hypothetical protein [Parasaccharibacter apium]